jgi:hypothetical protein
MTFRSDQVLPSRSTKESAKMETPMKTFYEVADWESDGGSPGAANTIEAAAMCHGPRRYVVAVFNGWHRRPLTEEEELQLSRARSALEQQESRINADRERAKLLQQNCTHGAVDWRGHCISLRNAQ